jgi:metallo-beta-lactamase class B
MSISAYLEKRTSLWWKLVCAFLALVCVLILSYLKADYQMRILLVLALATISGAAIGRFIYALQSGKSLKRKIWLGIVAVFTVITVILGIKWKAVSDNGGQVRQEPFCIAGNLYYVGTTDVTSFLLTGPEGHILIDGGYPGTADLIMKNINLLGFKLTDVKILLNSHAHLDHAGGLAALQKASGAELWISEPEVDMIASGGAGDRNMGLMNFLVYIGMAKYPVPRIDHVFRDGDKIRLGSIELTAHITPGHTPGCTSWTFPVQDGNRRLLAVSIGSLTLIPVALLGQRYDAQLQHEFEQSFKTLRSLPADIFLGSHANFFSMRKKLKERDTAADPVAPFIDREGYLEYIADAEKELHKAIKEQ